MATPSHCLDLTLPIGPQLAKIKTQYDNSLLTSHADRNQVDWDNANDDFELTGEPEEVKRPPDGTAFFSSALYGSYIQAKQPLFAIRIFEERISDIQDRYDTIIGAGEDLQNLSYLDLQTLLDLDSSIFDTGSGTSDPALITQLDSFKESLDLVLGAIDDIPCPANLKAFVDQTYIDSVIEFFKSEVELQYNAIIDSSIKAKILEFFGLDDIKEPDRDWETM